MIYIGQYEGKPVYHEVPFVKKTDKKSTKENVKGERKWLN